jgi:hypothetical protein
METISAYRTADGKIFESPEKAAQHEEFIKHSDVIEAFLNSGMNPYRGPQRIVARNTIIHWQLWRTDNVPE